MLDFRAASAYKDRLAEYQKRTGLKDSAITGLGQIEGRAVAISALDFSFLGGTLGSVAGERITRELDVALPLGDDPRHRGASRGDQPPGARRIGNGIERRGQCVGIGDGHAPAPYRPAAARGHSFSREPPYNGGMIDDFARADRVDTSPVSVTEGGGPWGSGGDESADGGDGGRVNPWTQPPRKRRAGLRAPGQPGLEELIRRSRARFGGGMPGGARPIWGYALAAFVALWLVTTSVHQIDPQERGVITRFGRYAGTLGPGLGLTMPAPVDVVTRVNVDQINSFDVPGSGGRNLVLTGDGNAIDLTYAVRWSVRDPELYLFEFAEPEDTIREVAESAMRGEIGHLTMDQAIGPLRSQIEVRVAARLQSILDRYHAGVVVQGVAIKQADPPQPVADAFKAVSAAQQQARADLNSAQSYAEQVNANALAAAAAFDKVYAAYKLAPDVTRKRMYYETMEAVLGKSDKIIVDTPGAANYLPIPIPQARGAPARPAPDVPAPPPAPAPAAGGQ